MALDAKIRSQLVRKRFGQLVALHRRIRGDHPDAVILLLQGDRRQPLPVNALPSGDANSDDGDAALAFMPLSDARVYFADAPELSKWDAAAADAMDVAVVAAGGVSLMRLTSR